MKIKNLYVSIPNRFKRAFGGEAEPQPPMYYYLLIENAEGYVLIAMYLFICMRVTRITQKVLNRIA